MKKTEWFRTRIYSYLITSNDALTFGLLDIEDNKCFMSPELLELYNGKDKTIRDVSKLKSNIFSIGLTIFRLALMLDRKSLYGLNYDKKKEEDIEEMLKNVESG